MSSLVRVWTNVGQRKPKALLAKVVSRASGPVYTIRYLSPVSEEDESGRQVFRYEDDTYEVDDDSVAEWLDADTEEDVGYKEVEQGAWIREDDDSDYVPSSESESEDEDESEETEEEEPEDSDEDEEENSSDYE